MLSPHLSIVSPVYLAEKIVPELVRQIEITVSKITPDYEIILVEDGSPDNSWAAIKQVCQTNKKVKGIKLSRNFGQHYAITAGLDSVRGEWVVVMDCDLQDRPEEIINLYNNVQHGYEIAVARRSNRQDPFLKRLYSKLFYRTLGYLTGSKQDETIANFGIYNKKVIDEIKRMREKIRYFPTMVQWVGFKTIKVDVEHASRNEGKSSYDFNRMLNLALDIILAFSDKPLRLTIKLGIGVSLIALIMIVSVLIKWLTGSIIILGYTSLIISIWFLSGCLLTTLGIVGLYMGKTFEGIKNRPLYIVEQKENA
jgi:glycosyltransferase involved in cell wall biosynthesis